MEKDFDMSNDVGAQQKVAVRPILRTNLHINVPPYMCIRLKSRPLRRKQKSNFQDGEIEQGLMAIHSSLLPNVTRHTGG